MRSSVHTGLRSHGPHSPRAPGGAWPGPPRVSANHVKPVGSTRRGATARAPGGLRGRGLPQGGRGPGRVPLDPAVLLRVPGDLPAAAGVGDGAGHRAQRRPQRAAHGAELGADRLPGHRHAAAHEHPLAGPARPRADRGCDRHGARRARADHGGAGDVQHDLGDPLLAPAVLDPPAGARRAAARRDRAGRDGQRDVLERVGGRRRPCAVAGVARRDRLRPGERGAVHARVPAGHRPRGADPRLRPRCSRWAATWSTTS
jgi:hypothetical protein